MKKIGKNVNCDNCKKEVYKSQWKLDSRKYNFCNNNCRKEFHSIYGYDIVIDNSHLSAKFKGKVKSTDIDLPTKICETCNKEFQKVASLSWAEWEKQKYCKFKCYHEAQKSLRSKILDRYDNKCEKCGSGKKLTLHHNEYYYTNEKEDNEHISLFCSSCHTKLHADLRRKEGFYKGNNQIKQATIQVLKALNININDENFRNTPARVSRSFMEMCEGLTPEGKNEIKEILSTKFPSEYKGLITFDNIVVFSLCPHHLLTVKYRIHVGIILNDGNCIGLSKIPRLVKLLARKPVLQETLTEEVTSIIDKNLDTLGTICVIDGQHSCVQARGVEQVDAIISTSSVTKAFLYPENGANPKAEFFSMIERKS